MLPRETGALHESYEDRAALNTSSNRAFGWVFAIVFATFGCWLLINENLSAFWSFGIALALAILAQLRPQTLGPLNRIWTRFGLLLHHVTNPVIMGTIFFIAVVPTGVVMKVLGKDPLRLRLDRNAPTYWIERRPPGPDPETMKNQF